MKVVGKFILYVFLLNIIDSIIFAEGFLIHTRLNIIFAALLIFVEHHLTHKPE